MGGQRLWLGCRTQLHLLRAPARRAHERAARGASWWLRRRGQGKPVGTPNAAEYFRIIAEHKITNFFTAPTALRAIRQHDPEGELAKAYDLSSLRSLVCRVYTYCVYAMRNKARRTPQMLPSGGRAFGRGDA